MITFGDRKAEERFNKWMAHALECQAKYHLVSQQLIHVTYRIRRLEKAGREDTEYHELCGNYETLSAQKEQFEWANNFLGYVHRWMCEGDNPCETILYAMDRDNPDPEWAQYFDFALFRRAYDENGLPLPPDVSRRVYNGGFMNHGTVQNPRWQSHT